MDNERIELSKLDSRLVIVGNALGGYFLAVLTESKTLEKMLLIVVDVIFGEQCTAFTKLPGKRAPTLSKS